MRKRTITLSLLISTLVTYYVLVVFVDAKLASRPLTLSLTPCDKTWSTRGLVTDLSKRLELANSIVAINLAISNGAKGVEVDVYYDVPTGQFVVSHDRPYNLKNGELLSLEKLFLNIQEPIYVWLDFKKLTRLSESEVSQAVSRLKAITNPKIPAQRVIIETEHPIKLAAFRDAGFLTLLDTQPLPESYLGTSLILNLYKLVYYFYDFTLMGMNYGEFADPVFGQQSEAILQHVPLFIYHVPNDLALIRRLAAINNVQVVLNTDEAADLFLLPHCELSNQPKQGF